MKFILEKYTKDQLEHPTKELKDEIEQFTMDCFYNICKEREVWFMINEDKGKYEITIFYDNKLNMASGEDL